MTPAERAAREAKIEDCERRGVCFWCDQPILDGQARYTSNHSHWDCNEKATTITDADLAKMDKSMQELYARIKRLKII